MSNRPTGGDRMRNAMTTNDNPESEKLPASAFLPRSKRHSNPESAEPVKHAIEVALDAAESKVFQLQDRLASAEAERENCKNNYALLMMAAEAAEAERDKWKGTALTKFYDQLPKDSHLAIVDAGRLQAAETALKTATEALDTIDGQLVVGLATHIETVSDQRKVIEGFWDWLVGYRDAALKQVREQQAPEPHA